MYDLEINPVEDYMVIIRSLNDRISKIEKEIKEKAEETEETMLIKSILGFSYFSAMQVVMRVRASVRKS
ncbi:hypothetical protein AKJ63_01475 [candidate division MSBL1 archaeon SCGC-AAA259D18]|uniref:Uncharacterized protein n=1 Tax=candidate division MSBL1 archaeon SCGC-AAA259D18 TaxID=1698262 RepID=A0A133UB94_9EURY|nr:hypothetical protein AKJ63_01475 [candidate division MSBL1 archaeon SCGC-AAA259D18]